ncbi:phage tail tape measure protein, partial [Pseudomonas lundensis]
VFKNAINGLIEMLNKIPGVQIDAAFGDLPAAPQVPDIAMPQIQAQPVQTSPLMMAMPPKLLEMPGSRVLTSPAMPQMQALQPPVQAPA